MAVDRRQSSGTAAKCPESCKRAKKGAARGCKRPKSREETPKEGGGNARRYRTATTCHRSAQKASVLDPLFIQFLHGWPAAIRGRGSRQSPQSLPFFIAL